MLCLCYICKKLLQSSLLMRFILLFFLFYSFIYADIVADTKKPINLLSGTELYLDSSGQMKVNELTSHPEIFKPINEPFLNYGYILGQAVWIKFTLENQTDETLQRSILADNTMLDTLHLYTGNGHYLASRGTAHTKNFYGTLMFSFPITLEAKSKTTYYLHIFTDSAPLWTTLQLVSAQEAVKKDVTRQVILGLFFGGMLTLIVYNLFLLLFTKDSIYFFYVLYLTSIILQHETYTGMILYWLPVDNREFIEAEIYFAVHYLNIVMITMTLFTRQFLQLRQYPRLDKLIWVLLIVPLILSFLNTRESYLLSEAIVFYFIVLFTLWFVGLYAKFKRNPNANYYLIGWTFSLSGWLVLALHNTGIWSVHYIFEYTFEVLVMAEALLFSIALASRLNKLNREKEQLSQALITQQRHEKTKLESTVKERTKELQVELKNNELLLKELHHRVKNNMQFITSLYALKLQDNTDVILREKLNDVERKIQAMSLVHEMLYKENDLAQINTEKYFQILITNIKNGYDTSDICFNMDVQTNLSAEAAIYSGLIINELVTNAIKYAFEGQKGTISISLHKRDNTYTLIISDNGKGLDENAKKSFGLLMVHTLATEQLNGTIDMKTKHGTEFNIKF